MEQRTGRRLTAVLAVAALCSTVAVADWTISTLHEFTGTTDDGSEPHGSLLLDGSTLYGVTYGGGDSLFGTVFKMNTDGSGFTLLHEFAGGTTDGRRPIGGLILDGSTLYGMTRNGCTSDAGTVFSIDTDGSNYSILHQFTGTTDDGSNPYGNLTLIGGTLYGMTSGGGDVNYGTVFKMGTGGESFLLIHEFLGGAADGRYPYGSLTYDGASLYGMTSQGGDHGLGAVFTMDTSGGGFGLIHEFAGGADDGSSPDASLTLDGSMLYGMTPGGGDSGEGVIFSMNKFGTGFALLHEFSSASGDGYLPHGSLSLDGSALYGTTFVGGDGAFGVLFSIDTDGTDYTIQHHFGGGAGDGAYPYRGELTQGGSFPLYGLTRNGGADNVGTVFIVPEPASIAMIAAGTLCLALCRRRRK